MKSLSRFSFIVLFIFIGLSMTTCNTRNNAISNIEDLESKLFADTTLIPNKEIANNTVAAYIDFTTDYPEDEKIPEYLFKAAEISMSLMRSDDAIKYLEKICNDYPDYEKTPTCLFLQGFIYETQLKNNVMAQKTYSTFMKKYPTHALADDAKFSLNNPGKSDEEIIREFEEKLAKENAGS